MLIAVIVTGCGAERIAPKEAIINGTNAFEGHYKNSAEYLRHYWHGREGNDVNTDSSKITDIFGIPGIDESQIIHLSINDAKLSISADDNVPLLTVPCRDMGDRIEIDGDSKRAIYILVNIWNDKAVTLFLDGNGNLLIDKSEWGGGTMLIFASGVFHNWQYICRRK